MARVGNRFFTGNGAAVRRKDGKTFTMAKMLCNLIIIGSNSNFHR